MSSEKSVHGFHLSFAAINQATLRNWIEHRHGGGRSVVTDPPGDRDTTVAMLRKENAEVRRANGFGDDYLRPGSSIT
jgi:hypothetical protein